MTRARAGAFVLIVAALLAGCASASRLACGAGERAMVSEQLFFGTSRANGQVSAAEWSDFLADAVTPRFPEGFTAWGAMGQWRGTDGSLVREPSHVVEIVHAGDARADGAIAALIAEYKARFHQESVLRVRTPACAAF